MVKLSLPNINVFNVTTSKSIKVRPQTPTDCKIGHSGKKHIDVFLGSKARKAKKCHSPVTRCYTLQNFATGLLLSPEVIQLPSVEGRT